MFIDERLVGFIHAIWDGGRYAFLLDTMVAPDQHYHGIGTELVSALIDGLRSLGTEWLNVDCEPHLTDFDRNACGFNATDAALRLN